jgi:hypothetical protein
MAATRSRVPWTTLWEHGSFAGQEISSDFLTNLGRPFLRIKVRIRWDAHPGRLAHSNGQSPRPGLIPRVVCPSAFPQDRSFATPLIRHHRAGLPAYSKGPPGIRRGSQGEAGRGWRGSPFTDTKVGIVAGSVPGKILCLNAGFASSSESKSRFGRSDVLRYCKGSHRPR